MIMGKIKLDKQDVEVIRDLICIGAHTDTEIADMFNVSRKHINSIRNGTRWKTEDEHTRNVKIHTDNFKAKRVYIYRKGTV